MIGWGLWLTRLWFCYFPHLEDVWVGMFACTEDLQLSGESVNALPDEVVNPEVPV